MGCCAYPENAWRDSSKRDHPPRGKIAMHHPFRLLVENKTKESADCRLRDGLALSGHILTTIWASLVDLTTTTVTASRYMPDDAVKM